MKYQKATNPEQKEHRQEPEDVFFHLSPWLTHYVKPLPCSGVSISPFVKVKHSTFHLRPAREHEEVPLEHLELGFPSLTFAAPCLSPAAP